jgi:high-affinity iron transporter
MGFKDGTRNIAGTEPDRLKKFQPDPTVLQVTVWLLYLIPALALFFAPVGFASGKGKVKVADDQGSRPSKASKA